MALVALAFWFSSNPAPTRNGEKLIEPEHKNVHLIRHKGEVDGTLKITHKPSGDQFSTDFYDNNHYELPSQAGSGVWDPQLSRDYYLIDPGLDLGTWAGYTGRHGDSRDDFDVGLRYSPARLLFGTVAPDLLVGTKEAGVGISLYPPKSVFGPGWNHLGVGIGRLFDYHDSGQSTAFYLGFSTRY